MRSDELLGVLEDACRAVAPTVGKGKVADYIPALGRIDPGKLGAAVVTAEGATARFGDADEPFSIQSISKVFTLTMALQQVGSRLWRRVGREPSGNAFNSIVQLERERGVPRNPFINAGAIVLCDVLLTGRSVAATKSAILDLARTLADDSSIAYDLEVAESEAETGYRNMSLATFMKGFGNLIHPVDDVLDVYFHQCAIAMSCTQLARAMLCFAMEGRDPVSGRQFMRSRRARRINSIMLMCGHYDASGEFAFRVGLPGKSGVGGGIVAVVPDRAALAVWSPALNPSGNSHTGTLALERIVQATDWDIL